MPYPIQLLHPDLDPEETLSITLREEAECVPDVDENFLTWTKLQGDYLAEKNLLIAFFEEDCEQQEDV